MIRRSYLYALLPFALSAAVVIAGKAGTFEKGTAAGVGVESVKSETLEVSLNDRPGARAGGPAMIRTFAGRETFFAVQATSPEGLPLTIDWDFDGDGVFDARTDKPVAKHTYRRGGKYRAVFKVTDMDGISDTAAIEVVVNEGAGAQEAVQSLPPGPPLSLATTGADGDPRFYVVMINGGSEERFWVDVEGFYQTLTGTYHIAADDIFVLNHNGTDFYDGNPGAMIDYAATLDNVNTVFSQLAGVIDGDDTLLVWITDHGRGYSGPDNQHAS